MARAEVEINNLKGYYLNVTVKYSRKFRIRVWICLMLIKLAVFVGGFSGVEFEKTVTK